MSDVHESERWPTVHQPLERAHARLLLALRDTGRLSRAADALAITPSAASHRLREAEKRVGTALVEPDGRSIRLTAAGRHLADAAAVSESTLRSAEDTARWLGAGVAPRVRVAADFYDTAPWFELAGGDESDIGISVVRVGYEAGRDAVARRVADIAVELSPAGGGGAPLADDDLVAVVGPDHPAVARGELTLDDVAAATYLTAGQTPRAGFEHHEFMAPAGVFPERIVRIESVGMILQLVAAGRGLTIQPRLVTAPAERWGLGVVPLAGRSIEVRWDLVMRTEHDPATAQVAARIRAAVADATGDRRAPTHWEAPSDGR